MSERWAQEELDWLRENYANDGPREIGLLLHRSAKSVARKARELLGICRRRPRVVTPEPGMKLEQCRWTNGRGGNAVVLDSVGRLVRRGFGGYRLVKEPCTFAEAQAYIDQLPGKWQKRFGRKDESPIRVPRAPATPRLPQNFETWTALTPEQQAMVEQRILAHQARVAADLERIHGKRADTQAVA